MKNMAITSRLANLFGCYKKDQSEAVFLVVCDPSMNEL